MATMNGPLGIDGLIWSMFVVLGENLFYNN